MFALLKMNRKDAKNAKKQGEKRAAFPALLLVLFFFTLCDFAVKRQR
jgi:hypothetical protein